MKLRFSTKAILALLAGASLVAPSAVQAKILLNSDFETNQTGISAWRGNQLQDGRSKVVDSPDGKIMKFVHGPGAVRSELAGEKVKMGEEYWYSFRFRMPEHPRTGGIVGQWHGVPDFDEGEDWRQPILSLLIGDSGNLTAWLNADSRRVFKTRTQQVDKRFPLERVREDQWVNIVVNVKWSHRSDGFLRIWQNGERQVNYNGATAYNDAVGPYLKIGAYRSRIRRENNPDTFTVYFDNVRMGDRNSSYAEVSGSSAVSASRKSESTNNINLALNKAIDASSQQKENPLKAATDGNLNTRWSAQGYPQTLVLKLGEEPQEISRLEIAPLKGRAYQFQARTGDGRLIVDRRNNTQGGNVISASFKPIKTQYVKLKFTGCNGSSCSPDRWVSINEVKVF